LERWWWHENPAWILLVGFVCCCCELVNIRRLLKKQQSNIEDLSKIWRAWERGERKRRYEELRAEGKAVGVGYLPLMMNINYERYHILARPVSFRS
jgi:hypothetical protein